MKNSIFGLLIVSVLTYGMIHTEENASKTTKQTLKKQRNNRPQKNTVLTEQYSLFQLITTGLSGVCGGTLLQKPKYLPKFLAISGIAFFSIATIAPKFMAHCSKNIALGSYNTVRNKIADFRQNIETKTSNFKENTMRETVAVPEPATLSQTTASQNS